VIELTDSWISPSNEDDITFTVQTGGGETFKLRGIDIFNFFKLNKFSLIKQLMLKKDKNGLINYEHLQDQMQLML